MGVPNTRSLRYCGPLTGISKYRDCLGAFKANADFYQAFGNCDIRQMRRVWLGADHVRCVHPMCTQVEGYEAVMLSWEEILEGLEVMPVAQRDPLRPVQQSWVVYDDAAMVTLREDFGRTRVEATNVFERVGQFEWRMVHHHGSQSFVGIA